MLEIIPTIIAKTFEDLQEKVKQVEPYVKTAQLDIMDGIFVPNTTWPYTEASFNRHPELVSGSHEMLKQVQHDKNGAIKNILDNLKTDLDLEAHLMVQEPEKVLDDWLASPVRRIIVHWEAIESAKFKTQSAKPKLKVRNLITDICKLNKEIGIALNLETPISALDDFIKDIDLALLMSVDPGFGGQEFQESVLVKIKALRQKEPNVKIEVDGGINLENAEKIIKAGADFLAVGSAIFKSGDVEKTIKGLQEIF